jgi:hypothetical protein
VDQILAHYPYLLTLGPAMGVVLGWARQQSWLRGFGLLGTAVVAATLTVAGFGLLHGWSWAQWRELPIAVALLVGLSNVTGSTLGTALEALGVKRVAA